MTIDRQEETGKVGFIAAPPGRPIDVGAPEGSTPGAVAKAFLRQNARRLGLASSETSLRVAEEHRSAIGGRSVRVDQVHAGIPVFGGQFTVNLDENQDVLSVLGEASPIGRKAATEPAVPVRSAARTAIRQVAREADVQQGRLKADDPVLMYYDPRLLGAPGPFQSARLSWVMEVRATSPAVAHTVVVDAASGAVALSFSTIAHARSRTVCDANSTDGQYPCTTPVWTESSQPAGVDADVVAAFEYAGDTYDFFATKLGRDSLDGAGMTLVSTVDYCPPGDCPFANAFWDGAQMVYGDGYAVADDVVGHELAHGVTDFSSSLFYYMQSGAINESMSDIFGELIDLGNGAGTDDAGVRWLMGEDIPGIGAIRDMENPPAYEQPDRMNSPWYYGGLEDSGGVHYNSGVSNKAAYLLVDGGSFNGRTIGAIGADKTARLFYTVNNDLLVSGSDFADLANAMRQACTTLASAGTDGFTAADCGSVEQAILATEMDLNPSAAQTSVVAPCPAGVPEYAYRDDLESPSGQLSVVPIIGGEVWSYPQNTHSYVGFDATYATSGVTNIWGDNPDVLSDSALRMTTAVTVPANAYLYFNHAYGFESSGIHYDGGVLEYSTTGAGGPWNDAGALFTTGSGAGGYDGTLDDPYWSDNPLAGRNAFTASSMGYGASRADLASLAGQNVMFRWRIGTDSAVGDYGWFIDDISIHTCVADTTPPETTITSGPANGSTISVPEASFGFSSSEAGSSFQCNLDGAGYAPCTSPRTYSGLAEGSHTFSVRAVDGAGNVDASPATRTFTVTLPDTTAPETTITSGPANGSTISVPEASFGFASSEAGSSFQCSLDGAGFGACTSPKTYSGLAEGSHTFSVRAVDGAGNVDGSPATRTFTVTVADTTAPETTITSGPANGSTISVPEASFGFSSSEAGSSFQCSLDGAGFGACTSPKTYSGLAEGSHTFSVRAVDGAGNVDGSPAPRTFTVDVPGTSPSDDRTPPNTKITKHPKKKTFARKAKFGFKSTEPASTFQCKIDRKRWKSCTSVHKFKVKPGKHKFRVRAIDAAGNVDPTPAVWKWKVKRRS